MFTHSRTPVMIDTLTTQHECEEVEIDMTVESETERGVWLVELPHPT